MMDINEINETIEELENSSTTFDNCMKLASLYIVRDNLKTNKEPDETEEELHDILPSYLNYIEVKRKYQKQEIAVEFVYKEMEQLCLEIKEFISSLYNCTDTQRERNILTEMIKDIP